MKTRQTILAALLSLLWGLAAAPAQQTDELIIPAEPVEGQEVQEAQFQETVEDLAEDAEPVMQSADTQAPQLDPPAAQPGANPAQPAQPAQGLPALKKQKDMAPMAGYLQARRDVEQAPDLIGGPIKIVVTQEQGGVHVALPAERELDPTVFGTPELPRQYGGMPIMTGLPVQMRGSENGQYTRTTEKTPFGDANIVMQNGSITLVAVDAQAVDGAVTRDSLSFRASWSDEQGNTYEITCNRILPQGFDYPFFGGVVTNHILHGSSGIGSPLMPTQFAYVAFWGVGEVSFNGEVRAENQLIHGMLTEYVRGGNYELVFDENVEPERRHFQVLAAPVQVMDGNPTENPVPTGFTLDNGEELPFWHVMFANLNIETEYILAGSSAN